MRDIAGGRSGPTVRWPPVIKVIGVASSKETGGDSCSRVLLAVAAGVVRLSLQHEVVDVIPDCPLRRGKPPEGGSVCVCSHKDTDVSGTHLVYRAK
jgi:hypothetical protein